MDLLWVGMGYWVCIWGLGIESKALQVGSQTFTAPGAVRGKDMVITDVMGTDCGCGEAALGFLGFGAWVWGMGYLSLG